ncbi:negative regulator of flagellin synthesis FlgM [Oikeobacillus pervagus]|uniref:Negative regulator of flagellin synthesis n=1 Tax=Oikeobacillus pervagus TaxID=1325931 RepID=A0AAJ1SY28_9BACI|nr:flagellar biosynthesis anti-sigma factor FlgM [Oikeobacillus pervagus]MDQ0214958.1 negative regulator of flagellin synthesis FlgM [Oikeobacillus pervagus]
MKINQNFGMSGINPYKRAIDKLDGQKKTTSSQKDRVEISSTAKELQSSNLQSERQEKINALKQQIEAGQYKPDPKAIAKGILGFYRK